jgi:hypothetical protein
MHKTATTKSVAKTREVGVGGGRRSAATVVTPYEEEFATRQCKSFSSVIRWRHATASPALAPAKPLSSPSARRSSNGVGLTLKRSNNVRSESERQTHGRGQGVRENVQENGGEVALSCGCRLQCH